MKTVKVSYTGGEPWRGAAPFPQQSPGCRGIWGDYQFVFSNDMNAYDYWVVVDEIPKTETCTVSKRNTIFLAAEPPHIGSYPVAFLNQFGTVATCHPGIVSNPFVFANKVISHPALAWFSNKTYDELVRMTEFPKPKLLSVISSRKDERRYQFALAMKEEFGDAIDMFGRDTNSFLDKWDAHANYQYSIVLENRSHPDYFSEKLTDCYLAMSYPFYYGGNIKKYFPAGSFTKIDIDDPAGAIDIIKDTTARPMPESVRCALEVARNRVLHRYSFFPTVVSIIEDHPRWFDAPGTDLSEVTISDKWRFSKNASMFVKKVLAGMR